MIAALHIQACAKDNRTVLKNVYATTPFKVANITEDKSSGVLQLMLMSSSPGILDGDDYRLKIDLGPGADLELYTQSYQRLFNMKQSAKQTMEVQLSDGCSFYFVPHPAVPHKNADFASTNKIYLAAHCRLVLGEIITCGRKLNGEIFSFSKYHSITEIFINNKLVIKENLLLQPVHSALHVIGQMEGFTHQASLICLCEKDIVKECYDMINELLAAEKNIIFGISETPVSGLIIRILGQGAEQLYNSLQSIAGMISKISAQKLPVDII